MPSSTVGLRRPQSRSQSSKAQFVQYLAAYSGLAPSTVAAWANHEQGSSTVGGGNNWLNVETGPRGGEGPHSAEANYVESLSPQQAAAYTAGWLKKNQPGIAATAGKPAVDQASAIINSGWAASHYNHEAPSSFLSSAAGLLDEVTTGFGVGPAIEKGLLGGNPFQGPSAQETAKAAEAAAKGFSWTSLSKFAITAVLLLAGAVLIVYGLMVAVRPRESAASIPFPKAVPIPV